MAGLGRKEIWYFGYAVFIAGVAGALAHTAPQGLMGFAAVVTPVSAALYGGALGKLWVETRNGNAAAPPK